MRRTHTARRLALLPLAGLVAIGVAQDAPNRIQVEKEVTIPVEIALPQSAYCKATMAIEYLQRNTIASVEGTIENEDCAASNGDYTIEVRIRDENGELEKLEFSESWQRDDEQPVTFRADYQIGENVDLVSVRARRLRCLCADTPGE